MGRLSYYRNRVRLLVRKLREKYHLQDGWIEYDAFNRHGNRLLDGVGPGESVPFDSDHTVEIAIFAIRVYYDSSNETLSKLKVPIEAVTATPGDFDNRGQFSHVYDPASSDRNVPAIPSDQIDGRFGMDDL